MPAKGLRAAPQIAQGFVTASLVFCVGPLTILGSIQDGLMADYTLLAIKSTLDGFTAMALAASLGAGVILSAATVLGFQGAIQPARDPLRRSAGWRDAGNAVGDRNDGHRRRRDPEHRLHPARHQTHSYRELAAHDLHRTRHRSFSGAAWYQLLMA